MACDNSTSFAARPGESGNAMRSSPGVNWMAAGRSPNGRRIRRTDFPLTGLACGEFPHLFDERAAGDGGGVAGPDAGQSGHQLPGAALPDAEERLDRLAVQVRRVHTAEHLQNFWKSVKPGRFRRHRAGAGSTPC